MANESTVASIKAVKNYTGGAVGAGLVLIVLPCAALYYGTDRMGASPAMGLPILAIFGIMILFGALAIISTLFSRLGLSDPSQALALPEGSIRAAIALALIVLFAIISIMLYQSVSKPYVIMGLSEKQKTDLIKDFANHVIAIVPERCANLPVGANTAGGASNTTSENSEKCTPENTRFSVHLRQPPGQESSDLAKQLLILIGTLMTSVTSFYFASRATEPRRKDEPPAPTVDGAPPKTPAQVALTTGHSGDESHIDGCDVPIVEATPDRDLPVAEGGVQR